MYYLCGAGVILRIASGVKKRVNAVKIWRFPIFGFVHTPWLRKMSEHCLQRVNWCVKNAVNANFGLNGDESRTRIALSPFSTKNQIDNKYQTSYFGALSRSMIKQECHRLALCAYKRFTALMAMEA